MNFLLGDRAIVILYRMPLYGLVVIDSKGVLSIERIREVVFSQGKKVTFVFWAKEKVVVLLRVSLLPFFLFNASSQNDSFRLVLKSRQSSSAYVIISSRSIVGLLLKHFTVQRSWRSGYVWWKIISVWTLYFAKNGCKKSGRCIFLYSKNVYIWLSDSLVRQIIMTNVWMCMCKKRVVAVSLQ